MKINPELHPAKFIKRYKRFFSDVITEQGDALTLHCPNTGSMKNCLVAESACWYSLSNNPKRKLSGTLELVTTEFGNLAGINTHRANHLVKEAILENKISQLTGYENLRTEVKYGKENSRIDLLLEDTEKGLCYVEVKNVTLEAPNGLVMFPDAVTSRGEKHLRELIDVIDQGHRAVLFFCVQVNNALKMEVASEVDPLYAKTLAKAIAVGVEVIAWRADLSAHEIVLSQAIPCLQDLPVPERAD
ncbi:DNA/RNA nuclease SfsA [Porticoccaceae bacterium]|nr:DNA/RNA nuclease SfsA [Porticoccaceae bacterium]